MGTQTKKNAAGSLLTLKQASDLAMVPLRKVREQLRRKAVLACFVKDKAGTWCVDINNSSWPIFVHKIMAVDRSKAPVTPVNLELLKQEAAVAELNEQIFKTKKLEIGYEEARLAANVNAQKLLERDFASYIYFGYLEKLNVDLLGMMKRLFPRVLNLVHAQDAAGIRKLIEAELSAIIRDVKKAQADELAAWERGRAK